MGIDNEEVEFEIKCKMNGSWMNTFCSFLKTIEKCGKNGCSRDIIFYVMVMVILVQVLIYQNIMLNED